MTKKSIQRHNIILKRKNFLPSLVVTTVLGSLIVGLTYFTEPNNGFLVLLFYILIFIFLFFLISLLFASSKRGLIASILITFFLVLRMYGVGNILNAILLLGLGIIATLYERFTKRNS